MGEGHTQGDTDGAALRAEKSARAGTKKFGEMQGQPGWGVEVGKTHLKGPSSMHTPVQEMRHHYRQLGRAVTEWLYRSAGNGLGRDNKGGRGGEASGGILW